MRSFKWTVYGYIFFSLTIAFNVGLSLLIYSFVEDKNLLIKMIFILLFILFSAFICSVIDYIRRKLMIERPLKEILNATALMTRGNFKVRLIPHHSYEEYDEFDFIKDDLNKMVEELSKNEVLKTDFIANLSHEMKTPLSVIQNYAKALENESLQEELRKKYLIGLQESCKKISNLVTNILKLNKLENQKLIPEITRFNLSESLVNQVLQYEKIIENKNIDLKCDIEDNIYINSEESYLELIWNNLISNAIKFTNDKGKITVSLNKVNDSYIVKVSDTGCGIDSNTGKHIFDKFYQGDTSHSKEGNGLGLALVKKVIDVLGGTISVESEVGKGTTFTVEIKEV